MLKDEQQSQELAFLIFTNAIHRVSPKKIQKRDPNSLKVGGLRFLKMPHSKVGLFVE